MSLANLSGILWRERELLLLLLFKLEEEQLVLAAGRTRWLAHATHEVEMVLDQIRRVEVLRAADVAAVAATLGLPADASLNALANAVGPPWNDLLRQHRKAFLELTAEITALAEANRGLLSTGQRAVREALLAVDGTVDTYGPRGTRTASVPPARLVDEAI